MKRFQIGYVYIVLCAVIFSAVEVVLKHTLGMFHPMQITGLGFVLHMLAMETTGAQTAS